jgi:hypothetical protein
MKRTGFLFAVILTLVVSLVPLSGVSAHRMTSVSPSPALSLASAPAARVLYSKEIKSKKYLDFNGTVCMKYVQKIYWMYNYKYVRYWQATMKGRTYQPGWIYLGYKKIGSAGGVSYTYYYRWTHGIFYNPIYGYYYIDIEQEVYKDGTYWKDWFWHT